MHWHMCRQQQQQHHKNCSRHRFFAPLFIARSSALSLSLHAVGGSRCECSVSLRVAPLASSPPAYLSLSVTWSRRRLNALTQVVCATADCGGCCRGFAGSYCLSLSLAHSLFFAASALHDFLDLEIMYRSCTVASSSVDRERERDWKERQATHLLPRTSSALPLTHTHTPMLAPTAASVTLCVCVCVRVLSSDRSSRVKHIRHADHSLATSLLPA